MTKEEFTSAMKRRLQPGIAAAEELDSDTECLDSISAVEPRPIRKQERIDSNDDGQVTRAKTEALRGRSILTR